MLPKRLLITQKKIGNEFYFDAKTSLRDLLDDDHKALVGVYELKEVQEVRRRVDIVRRRKA